VKILWALLAVALLAAAYFITQASWSYVAIALLFAWMVWIFIRAVRDVDEMIEDEE
jgi:hypothetical protein